MPARGRQATVHLTGYFEADELDDDDAPPVRQAWESQGDHFGALISSCFYGQFVSTGR